MYTFETLQTFAPTCFDSPLRVTPGSEDESSPADWFVFPVTQTRDSGAIDQSNFASSLAAFREADLDCTNHDVQRYRHWGPGWFEIIVFRAPLLSVALDLVKRLEDYPILDEDDLSERESEDEQASWNDWARDDFARAMHKVYPDLVWALTWIQTDGQEPDDYTDSVSDETWDSAWRASNGFCEHHDDGPYFAFPHAVPSLAKWAQDQIDRARELGAFLETSED